MNYQRRGKVLEGQFSELEIASKSTESIEMREEGGILMPFTTTQNSEEIEKISREWIEEERGREMEFGKVKRNREKGSEGRM